MEKFYSGDVIVHFNVSAVKKIKLEQIKCSLHVESASCVW